MFGITTLKETGLLKSLSDGSTIDIDRKHKTSIKWKPNSQFVMCCNEIPRIADTTRGMIRRLAFIPFNMQLKDEEIDYMLYNKLISEPDNLRYIMTGAIFAYREVVKKGQLTKLDKQKELEQDFIEENQDPIHTFYEALLEEYNGLEPMCRWLNGKTTDEIYEQYKKWCEDNSLKPEPTKSFTRQFSKLLPMYMKKKVISIGGVKFNSYILNK